ncbi:hypothetical protein EPIR_2499 [Erwinia piriflorinigrans CFBP 5888]|uniref:Uncharacterized protein n=1 Tax=Erwinia piriflorinigrans CFBP 5888 TaxID=1161919 RepID=V5Z909_9GAMM|nr:hypothetical protein EPIR_2499 [Erwinia piriflorinigrans CFBP 5888]
MPDSAEMILFKQAVPDGMACFDSVGLITDSSSRSG